MFRTTRHAFREGYAQGVFVGGMSMFIVMLIYSAAWLHKADQRCKFGLVDPYQYSRTDGE